MKPNTYQNARSGLLAALLFFGLLGNFPPLKAQSCIGEQGQLKWLLFEKISGSNTDDLRPRPNFPQSPHWVIDLVSLASPVNYNDTYGSLIRGFIKAPETGSYQFNLTGDDRSLFYLSTDSTANGLMLRAEVPEWSGVSEHNKYAAQTSPTLTLTQGKYYYFEVINKEGGGGDFVRVHWKTPATIGGSTWAIVPGANVYDYACAPLCPVAGTPCDDADPTTTNDKEDGNCHCIGIPANPPSPCIGQRGKLTALYYDGIPTSFVQAMYDSLKYPLQPDRAEILTLSSGPATQTGFDFYGTRVRGYLRPPVSGEYRFNVTGDNEIRLMLGPNDTTTIADEIAFNDGHTNRYDHYNTPEQTSAPIMLTGGQFYAIEWVHKENNGNDYHNIFWKTPFATDTLWHFIDGMHLYQYDCELACIPENTPCDDANPNTFNDRYDANCNCAGTPCSDPECTNALNYTPYDPCHNHSDRHTPDENTSWLSCQPAPSPNPARGNGHWILYDLGEIYALDQAQIWNLNTANNTAQGINQVVIDYSLNGIHWLELGTFNWQQAPGVNNYEGFLFQAVQGVSARYVLITALSNFTGVGGTCMGLSEVAFHATTCPEVGEPCDDGNPDTANDTYNLACYCMGQFSGENDCVEKNLEVNDVPIPTAQYTAQNTITSFGLVKVATNVAFIAGESVTLLPGFEVQHGAVFLADIDPCAPPEGFFKRLFKRKKATD